MALRARPFHDDGTATLPVAIVETDGKQLGVAAIVGDFASGTTSGHGQACIDLLGVAVNQLGLFGTLHKVEVATEAGAAARVEMTIACSADGDTIVFMCADAAIFDRAWQALNVRKWP